jgi:putative zinc finger/helix-turn-helix YgiT family protein
MKKSVYCLPCRKTVEADVVERKETYTVKGESIEILAQVAVCPQCNQDLYDDELNSQTQQTVFNQYRQKHGLLTPEEIRRIRGKYKLSQKAFSRLLGFGEVTIHRYELGSIQEKNHDLLIRQAEDADFIHRRYEENPKAVRSHEKKSFKKRLADLLQMRQPDVLSPKVSFYKNRDIYTGFREFDLLKTMNMIIYFAKECLVAFYPTKANKMLWFADMLHYRFDGCSISGSRYLRYLYGPVPEEFQLLYPLMEKERFIDLEYREIDAEQGIVGQAIHARRDWDKMLFSESEIKIMKFVAKRFRLHSSRQISEESQEEEAYKETPKFEFIPYSYAKRLSLVNSSLDS